MQSETCQLALPSSIFWQLDYSAKRTHTSRCLNISPFQCMLKYLHAFMSELLRRVLMDEQSNAQFN